MQSVNDITGSKYDGKPVPLDLSYCYKLRYILVPEHFEREQGYYLKNSTLTLLRSSDDFIKKTYNIDSNLLYNFIIRPIKNENINIDTIIKELIKVKEEKYQLFVSENDFLNSMQYNSNYENELTGLFLYNINLNTNSRAVHEIIKNFNDRIEKKEYIINIFNFIHNLSVFKNADKFYLYYIMISNKIPYISTGKSNGSFHNGSFQYLQSKFNTNKFTKDVGLKAIFEKVTNKINSNKDINMETKNINKILQKDMNIDFTIDKATEYNDGIIADIEFISEIHDLISKYNNRKLTNEDNLNNKDTSKVTSAVEEID